MVFLPYIFCELLGMSPEEVKAMEDEEVIY